MSATALFSRGCQIFLLALLFAFSPPLAAEGLRADKTELATGETVTVRLDGVTSWINTRWKSSPEGIIRVEDRSNTEAGVTALKPGTANLIAVRPTGDYQLQFKVLAAPDAKDPKGGWKTKIEGMAKVLGYPELHAGIVRMLAEVNDGSRTAREFYADLAKAGGNMFDVIAVRSRLVDGDPAFRHDVLGNTLGGGGTNVEMNLLSWRRTQTLAAIDAVVKRFIAAGRVPANGFSLIIAHVGKWATQDLNALTFTGDIDFSFVSNDTDLAEAMKEAFAKEIKERTGLDPKSLDSVATAHGKAGLEVYIGKHGMAFAEEQMKINEVVDMESGARKQADLDAVAGLLTRERALADAMGVEVRKPALSTEPGLSMEMVRHFGHDIVKPKIFDMANAVVKAAKYLDRSYKSLDKAGGTPADPDLARFAQEITELANAKPQTAAIREKMIQRISEFLGSAPKTVFDQGSQKLVLSLDPGRIAAFHEKAGQAMWKTVEQGSRTRTQEMDARLRDLTERQRRGDNVDAEVEKLRADMVELVDMVEAEMKAIHDKSEIPRSVVDNNARVRALMNILAGRFGTKVLSEEELKDKKYVEELLKAEGQHGSDIRRQMTAAYIMERSLDALMRSPEIAMGGVEKTNQMLDYIDDKLLGPVRGDGEFHDFEVEMNLLRQAALDPKQKAGVTRQLQALKSQVALKVKQVNQKFNNHVQAKAANRQAMKFMMVYGLVDEMKSYRDAFNNEGWSGFATELFRRRIPLGSAVEGVVMGNTYRAAWDVVTTLVPPLALPEAAWGLGTAIGTQSKATYWNEQLALFSDGLYDSAKFKLMEVETHGGAKVGVYRLVSVKHKGITLDLARFAEMRQEQVEALREEIGRGRLDWKAYQKEFQGLTNWMEVDTVLQKTIANNDPGLALIEEMMQHPNVGKNLMERLTEKGLVRWEEVKLGFITNLIKRLEDRKQADQALGAGMLPDLFAELRQAAADLEIEDAMHQALDAEVDTNNWKAFVGWLWQAKRDTLGQPPSESETTRAAQVVKKYMDIYKDIRKSRDSLQSALPPAARGDGRRYLTGDLFLSGRAEADQDAAGRWVKHVGESLAAVKEALLAIKKAFLPNLPLDEEDETYLQRAFPRELWVKPYLEASKARGNVLSLLDRALEHGKARNAILDEYREWLEKQSPVQLTVTVLDAGKPVSGAAGDLKPTDVLGKPGSAKASGNQLVFGVPTGRYRLTIQAPGYEEASQDVLLGRNLNPTPKLTVSLTPSDQKADAGAEGALAERIAAALKARDWQRLVDMLAAEKKRTPKFSETEAWQANLDAIDRALRTLKDERMRWLLAWEPYIRELERVDNRAYAKLKDLVDEQVIQFGNRCFEKGSDPAHLRGERCRKEGYAYEEKCLPKSLREAHWTEQKRIRTGRNLLPNEVHLMHSTGFPSYQRFFEKVEALAKEHGLPFPYPEPVVTRIKYESPCARLDETKSGKKPDDLGVLKVSVAAPTASIAYGKPVTLNATASGGKGPYSYAWSSGGGGQRVSVTPRWSGEWTVTVTATDAEGQMGEGSATLRVEPAKFKLMGTQPKVFYGSQATLSLPGAAPPPPAPNPCAGRGYTSNNPFDECAKVVVDPCPPPYTSPFCVDTTHSGTIDYTGGKGASTPPRNDDQRHYIPDPDREEDAKAPSIKGKQVVWLAEPAVTFKPPTSTDGKTQVTYDRMDEVKLWCEIQEEVEGALRIVGECEETTVQVIAPKFSVSFSPPEGQGRIGQEIRARVKSTPEVADKLIDFRWLDPSTSNRMEYSNNARDIGFKAKDAKPVVLKALARVPYHGDEIANIDANYTGQLYQVTAKVREPGLRPMMWDPKKGGLVPVPKGSYVTHERIFLSAEIVGAQGGNEPEGVRWNWTVNDGTTLSSTLSSTPTVSRSSAGTISAHVEARDADGIVLGGADVSVSVIEVSDQPPKPTPAEDKTEAKRLSQQAENQLKQGDLPGAIQSAREARQRDAKVAASTARKVANAAKKAGWKDVHERDFDQAIPNLEAASELNPADKDAATKLDKAKRFAKIWPRVEEKAREFDGQMAEKKLWTAQQTMLQMQDLQHEMTGGMANPLSKKVMDDFNAGMAEYNVFMRETEAAHTRAFKEQDWRAMLDNAETALRREHNPANEKVLKGNVEFARQMLREQAAKPARNVAGTWAIDANGYKGKLEIGQRGDGLSGRVWYDLHGRWETLEDVAFDGHTLTFTRPIRNLTQRYTGTLSGDTFKGSFTQQGSSRVYTWSANMKEAANPMPSSTASDGASLTLDRTRFKPGEPITVRFTALASWPGNAWVGIIPSRVPHGRESENDRHDVSYQYLKNRASGTLTFTAPGVGDWDFRMHDTDSNGKEMASVSFTVGDSEVADSGTPTLAPDKTVYAPGETIHLRFGGIEKPMAKDWIGLYGAGLPNEKYGEWHYLKGQSGGTLPFKVPGKPGAYEFRLFLNWPAGGYRDVARSPLIQVGDGAKPNPVAEASNAFPAQVGGRWKTSEGELTLEQTGQQVGGHYSKDGGEIVGVIDGNVLEGWWIENASGQRCATARNGRHHWGRVRWTFEGDRFTGAWSYCDKPVPDSGHRWTGERIGLAPAAAGAPDTAPGVGLIAAYALDGDARDHAGQNRHGTVNGARPTADRFGRAGAAMRFDGKSFIDLPLDINPAATPRLTFTAWVRADEIHPIRQVMSHDNGGYDRSLGIDTRGGGAGWSLFTGSGGVLGFKPVDKGRWTFVAGVWDQPARKARLHVDGAVFEKHGESGGGHGRLSLGRNPGYGEHFVGAIDDVRLYGRALSTNEIDAIRNDQANASGVAMSPGEDGWETVETRAGMYRLEQGGNQLRVARQGNNPGGLQYAGLRLKRGLPLAGDFEAQVDFSDARIEGGLNQVELQASFSDGSLFFVVRDREGNGSHIWAPGIQGDASCGRAGSLRLERRGGTVTGYCDGRAIGSAPRKAELIQLQFVLQNNRTNDPISVIFHDWRFTAGAAPYQGGRDYTGHVPQADRGDSPASDLPASAQDILESVDALKDTWKELKGLFGK